MRAVGDEARPPCHKNKGSLLSCDHPSKLFDSQDSVGREWCSFRWKLHLNRTAQARGFSERSQYEQGGVDYSWGYLTELSIESSFSASLGSAPGDLKSED